MLDRSIGLERTVQIRQYEPLKVSTWISEVPAELWQDKEFINNLWNLQLVQIYRIIFQEAELRSILNSADNEEELLAEIEDNLVGSLNLENIVINVNINIGEEE